jgi:hypothetical protein
MRKENNIFDLVERAAARYGIPRLQLWQEATKVLTEKDLPIVKVLEPADPAGIQNWLIGVRALVDNYHDIRGGVARTLKLIIVREADFERWFRRANKLRRRPQSGSTGYRDAARKTGPKSRKLQSVIAAMEEDVRAGRQTTDTLRVMSDKDLVSAYGTRFGCGRTTCREARDRVVSEFDGIKSRQIAAKDK